jgi:hypothetical protein
VHQDVHQRLSYDSLAVHLDALLATVGFGTEFGDDTTVDTHPTSHDEFFRFAPRSYASPGKNLLQSFCHDLRVN